MDASPNKKTEGMEALPPNIQAMLKRKSSRDPNSRFANKLHMLLNYAENDPIKQEFIGACWTDGGNFKINKKRLIQIMDIKLNTLNVNLKDLKFQQMHSDQSGWTLWRRDGFTPDSTIDDIVDAKPDKSQNSNFEPSLLSNESFHLDEFGSFQTTTPMPPSTTGTPAIFNDEIQQSKLAVLKDISIVKCDLSHVQLFKRIVISIWEELIDSPIQKLSTSPTEFIGQAAIRFRASHQKLENAKEILSRIFICSDSSQLTIADFAKFMARFGPEETLMQKVGSLLKSSNLNGNWLRLQTAHDSLPGEPETSFYGFFDDSSNNGFVLHKFDKTITKVYNIIDVPSTEPYLIDSDSVTYSSWEDYFIKNPVVYPEFPQW